ncbi:MAG: hypothetical protein A2V70_16060 [Planctomycetes bacterium RBG_13_63_9]|nr:MAG: hypothetical protein A2V70_16060 [Planctomycetes bacterium RBG_13_63_9]
MFESSEYRWRETYFVLFDSSKRPTLKAVEQALSAINEHYELTNLREDGSGRIDSLTLVSPDDFAAVDICYTDGEEVLEHAANLIAEMEPAACEPGEAETLRRMKQYDGRFDVLHFEHVLGLPQEEEIDEMLDPSALLLVLAVLAKITGGVAIDPQGGTILPGDD